MAEKLIWGLLPDDNHQPRIEFGEDTETKEAFLKINGEKIKNYEPEIPVTPENPDIPVDCIHMEEILWSNLIQLRNSHELIPGRFYRITDYQCHVSTELSTDIIACSREHQFDIIVQALSSSTLSEDARAIAHAGDEYFTQKINIEGFFACQDDVLQPLFIIFEDTSSVPETYSTTDKFIGFKYEINDEGKNVPVLYATDMLTPFPDLEDGFWFLEQYEYNGQMYDRWLKIEKTATDMGSVSILTKHITVLENGQVRVANQYIASDSTIYMPKAHLSAWQLKYCIDNDIARFEWAADTGKGVIYYMKDEWDNEASYDFKNIQFARYKGVPSGQSYTIQSDEKSLYLIPDSAKYFSKESEESYDWYYTFSALNEEGEIVDASLQWFRVYDGALELPDAIVANNVINRAGDSSRYILGNNVFYYNGSVYDSRKCVNNAIEFNSRFNTLVGDAVACTIKNDSHYNIIISGVNNVINDHCVDIVIDYDVRYTTIGAQNEGVWINPKCQHIITGARCMTFSIEAESTFVTVGDEVAEISLRDSSSLTKGVHYVTIGDYISNKDLIIPPNTFVPVIFEQVQRISVS